ncbi:MAG TPA: CRISPR-associated helicase Cas3' [Ruminiclostridium sp.]|nr:CRISPR-associated helicase Cas3' [Ruminiclostridium sp.]
MDAKKYYAHTKSDQKSGEVLSQAYWQPLAEHLRNVSELARKFGDCFGSGELAGLSGMLHDIGKYSDKFQKRLSGGESLVDHSTAGAVEAIKRYGDLGFILGYCIAGHHAGLPDGGNMADTHDDATLRGRLLKGNNIENYENYSREINPILDQDWRIPIHPLYESGFSLSFYIRMLYSCLVDADFLDTEKFMDCNVDRKIGEDIPALTEKLERFIQGFGDTDNPINQKRTQILNNCLQKDIWNKDLYTLTVPTGGGKTITSLAFALRHAKFHEMKHVIYVIPYNSIIEQNAAVFKNILGEENVLEHHSNFNYDDSSEMLVRQRLATENWDMPVVVTTTVQFFESLFANRSSKCRKLHNLADSVIIFDEAQMLPLPYLLPCVRAITELVRNYGCTAVLCSATQPALGSFFPKDFEIKELCDGQKELFEFFKRTSIRFAGQLSDDELAERLNSQNQVLCIVNTRKQAQTVFQLLNEEGAFHLSTLMYPKHRSRLLTEIRKRLINGLPCRVIATSLIEAGVDVDFPVVYRAQAGLDSEIQAAGRCNREGKREISPVYIFEPEQKYQEHLPAMQARPARIARSVAGQFDDCTSAKAINAYFMQLYMIEDKWLDSKNIVKRFENGFDKGLSFPFAAVADEFSLIDNATRSVLIPDNDDAQALAAKLREGQHSRKLLRQIQQYCVNVYENHYKALNEAGSILPLDSEIAVLTDMDKYNEKTGLEASVDTGVGIFV